MPPDDVTEEADDLDVHGALRRFNDAGFLEDLHGLALLPESLRLPPGLWDLETRAHGLEVARAAWDGLRDYVWYDADECEDDEVEVERPLVMARFREGWSPAVLADSTFDDIKPIYVHSSSIPGAGSMLIGKHRETEAEALQATLIGLGMWCDGQGAPDDEGDGGFWHEESDETEAPR